MAAFSSLISALIGISKNEANIEFEQSIERLFFYASMSDKFEGSIHNPPIRGLTLAVKEPIGVIANILDDKFPLLSLITVLGSNFASGNASILIPGQKTSLIATELYQLLETSDFPAGYVNILTTKQNSLNLILAEHENIDGIWSFIENDNERIKILKGTSSNLKRYWCPSSKNLDWSSKDENFLHEFLYQSTQIKNIWIPYGE